MGDDVIEHPDRDASFAFVALAVWDGCGVEDGAQVSGVVRPCREGGEFGAVAEFGCAVTVLDFVVSHDAAAPGRGEPLDGLFAVWGWYDGAVPDDELAAGRVGARYPRAGVQAAQAAGQLCAGLAQAVSQLLDMAVEFGLGVGVMVAFGWFGPRGLAVVGGVFADDVPVVGGVHDPAGRVGRPECAVQRRVQDVNPARVHRWASGCAGFTVGDAVGDGVLRWVGGDCADFLDFDQGVIARGVELLATPLVDPARTIGSARSAAWRQGHVRSVVLVPLVADEGRSAIE